MNTKLLIFPIFSYLVICQAYFGRNKDGHPTTQIKKATSERELNNIQYEDPSSWRINAQKTLAKKLSQRQVVKTAKNLIIFLGDGWGITTMTLGRIFKGQTRDHVKFGEEGVLHSDTFPFSGSSKTYCVDSQVADSACSATAYLCGVKTNSGTIGVNSDVQRFNCSASEDSAYQVSSIFQWAQTAGKATGIVTTTRVTHATPAGAYAHTANRDWESDYDVINSGDDPDSCSDIAEQLILSKTGKKLDVILGGGRENFLPESEVDLEGYYGIRKDGKHLINVWKQDQSEGDSFFYRKNATYVETVEQLLRVDAHRTDKLLGLFAPGHLAYYYEQAKNKDPTLTDMTKKAIEILKKNENGFVLLVEGGKIDLAHHENRAMKALWEALEFDRAIKAGDEMTSEDDTLIVVTADHSHSFSFSGYADRGTHINGFGGYGDDELPYSIMGYANGPGFIKFESNMRHDISQDDLSNMEYRQVPLVPLEDDTHGGEDVIVLAKGPFSHLFTGVFEQNYIPHAMAYAACIGPGIKYCGGTSGGYSPHGLRIYEDFDDTA